MELGMDMPPSPTSGWRQWIKRAKARRLCTVCFGFTLIAAFATLGFIASVGIALDKWPAPWLGDLFRFPDDDLDNMESPPPVAWEVSDPHAENPEQATEVAYVPGGSHAPPDDSPSASASQSIPAFPQAESTLAHFETEGAAEDDEPSSAVGSTETAVMVDSDVQRPEELETPAAAKEVVTTRTAEEPASQATDGLRAWSVHSGTSARTVDFETQETEADSHVRVATTENSDPLPLAPSKRSAVPPLLFTSAVLAPATAYIASAADMFSTAAAAFFSYSPPAPDISSYPALDSSRIPADPANLASPGRSALRENVSATDATVASPLPQTVQSTSAGIVKADLSTWAFQNLSAARYVSLSGQRVMPTAPPSIRELSNVSAKTTTFDVTKTAHTTTTAETTTTVRPTTTTAKPKTTTARPTTAARPTTTTARPTTTAVRLTTTTAKPTTTTARPTTTTARPTTTTTRPATTAARLAKYVPGYIPSIDTIPGIPPWVNGTDDIKEWFKRLPGTKYLGETRAPVVVSSIDECARIGKDVLLDGGSAIDGAIATQVCHGFFNPISAGIGGGSFMLVFDETRNQDVVFNAREAAPWSINVGQYESNPTLALEGGPAIAVPGEVAGYYEAWKRFGKVAWNRLFTRTIYLCEHGHVVSSEFAETLAAEADFLGRNAVLREDYFYNGKILAEDMLLRRPRLGHTLRRIAEDPMSFYTGDLASDILLDLADEGARWKAADLSRYRVAVGKSMRYDLAKSGRTLLTAPAPSLGLILGHALGVVDDFDYTDMSDSTEGPIEAESSWKIHKVIESTKYGFGLRINIGDPAFNPDVNQLMDPAKITALLLEDARSILHYPFSLRSYYKQLASGEPLPEPAVDAADSLDAVQTTVVDAAGLHVSLTSSIGLRYGCKRVGRRTGIVFNSAMADFTRSVSTMFKKRVNWMIPGARPASTMVPSIVINNNFQVEVVAGSTRGSRGISALAWAILNRIAFRKEPRSVVWRFRIYPDLITNYYEPRGLRESMISRISHMGHWFRLAKEADDATLPSLWKISDGKWFGHPDWRRSKGYLSSGGMA